MNGKTTTPYILNRDTDGQTAINEALGKLIDQTVCVAYTTSKNEKLGERKNFEPQISVQAVLEGNAETGRFRVLIDDDTFSYFYNDSVWSMCRSTCVDLFKTKGLTHECEKIGPAVYLAQRLHVPCGHGQ